MDFERLAVIAPEIMRYTGEFVNTFENKYELCMALGMICDYWTATHGSSPAEILGITLDASQEIEASIGKADAYKEDSTGVYVL